MRKAIIDKTGGGDIMVLFPEGDVQLARDPEHAAALVRQRDAKLAADNEQAVAVTEIEWRRFGKDFTPPEAP